ncbi:hypothetical protein GUJ93_ZPchr0002g26784 [Zizania palustris]|uniref:Uncharacterized protein n=1 Tax=Zizania palustris TaxID=103762 RepID=A0A8J5S1K1_ZIZPA|nr:hypothetical protein GUJ93_ZPchr0002g26784 [Zizania palustris]
MWGCVLSDDVSSLTYNIILYDRMGTILWHCHVHGGDGWVKYKYNIDKNVYKMTLDIMTSIKGNLYYQHQSLCTVGTFEFTNDVVEDYSNDENIEGEKARDDDGDIQDGRDDNDEDEYEKYDYNGEYDNDDDYDEYDWDDDVDDDLRMKLDMINVNRRA